MKPLKCVVGVTYAKFLGFIMRNRGIELDLSKIKTIIEMSPPKTLKQQHLLQGKLAHIIWFISNLLILVGPIIRKSLILYTTTLKESLRALLAQNNEGKKKCFIIYKSMFNRSKDKILPY